MKIKCKKCHTVFRLDKALIKKEGTKLRCSKCKYKFKIYAFSVDESPSDIKGTFSSDQNPPLHLGEKKGDCFLPIDSMLSDKIFLLQLWSLLDISSVSKETSPRCKTRGHYNSVCRDSRKIFHAVTKKFYNFCLP